MRSIPKFVLVLGPSGVGKSTVIREIIAREPERFVYVKPYMTRPLRDGETDKVSISPEKFDLLEAEGSFLAVNELYGVKYGTPSGTIQDLLDQGSWPILDWPVKKLDLMREAFPQQTVAVYLYPPTEEELKERLDKDGRDPDGVRLAAYQEEREWMCRYSTRPDISLIAAGPPESLADLILCALS